jgi:RNA polymerase sigma-70 factor (ECF subfamily)
VKSEDMARELLQEAFLRIWEKRAYIDPKKSFRSYLFQITENLAYDFFRRVAMDKKLLNHMISIATESYDEVNDLLARKEYSDLLQSAIEALPPKRRQIFRLCKLDGKSYEETSRLLGISISTISDHIVKATRSIRRYCYTHQEILIAIFFCMLFEPLCPPAMPPA